MRNFIKISLAAFISAMVLNACSVQQRYHRKGFNVNWNHTSIKVKNDKKKMSNEEELVEEETITKINKSTNYSVESNPSLAATDNQFEGNLELNSTESAVSTSDNNTTSNSFVLVKNENQKNSSNDFKEVKKDAKKIVAKGKVDKSSNNSSEVPTVLLFILCFIIPPVAVGFATDWDLTPVLWNVVWTLLCGFPGVIHAIIHVLRNR